MPTACPTLCKEKDLKGAEHRRLLQLPPNWEARLRPLGKGTGQRTGAGLQATVYKYYRNAKRAGMSWEAIGKALRRRGLQPLEEFPSCFNWGQDRKRLETPDL